MNLAEDMQAINDTNTGFDDVKILEIHSLLGRQHFVVYWKTLVK